MEYFESLNRERGIGANSYHLRLGNTSIILDAGLDPKCDGLGALPKYSLLPPNSADAAIITHSHLDHTGTLPLLMRTHPEAEIFMSEPTGALTDAMLHNSINVMNAKRLELGIHEYPLFSHREVDRCSKRWRFCPIRKKFPLGRGDVDCELFDAGHILGSVGAMFTHSGKKIFYTGDVNFEDQTITKSAQFPTGHIDTLIVETTRGASARADDYTRAGETEKLGKLVRETIERSGSVLIPVFAMGKTQEIIVMLDELRKAGHIPRCPISIGGLSTKMTAIFDRFTDQVRRNHAGLKILDDLEVEVSSRNRKKDLSYSTRSIYALSSGMMSENTMSNSFAFQVIDNPKNSLAFVGYCDPSTPGGKILATDPGAKVQLRSDRPPVPVHCQVEKFDFSGHSSRDAIRDFIKLVHPKKLLLVHGDLDAMQWFADAARDDLPETEVCIPSPGERIPL